jgi:hypothetical protein
MKVTVWRPKTMIGLGAPEAYLGEDHPTQGDWTQTAKHDFQPDSCRPLLMMGREFLIYSMCHAREPYFLGIAVENFGAACKKLGYSLPLTDKEATWLTYPPEGLDPGDREEYQFMLGHIAVVFGANAAKEQAGALGIAWPSRLPPETGASRSR